MKKHLFKLYFAAFIVLVAASGSAFARGTLKFSVPFDFQVGGKEFSAGKYEMRVLGASKYILKNLETKENIFIYSNMQTGTEKTAKSEKLIFRRYGETFFLRRIFARRGTAGIELTESKNERAARRQSEEEHPQLAGEKSKPREVSVNSRR